MLAKIAADVNQPPCRVAGDTARPTLPTKIAWPLENPLLVTVPYNPSLKNFRDVFAIRFDDSTSGTSICAFLRHFNATIIGGFGHGTSAPAYVVRVPDPGATFEAVESLEAVMDRHPGVTGAFAMNYAGSFRLRGKPPIDSTKPRVPNEDPHITTNLVATPPNAGDQLYHRNVLSIVFDDSTSGTTIRSVFRRYSARIIGGFVQPGEYEEYVVQVPDPGSSWKVVHELVERIGSEPGVRQAGPVSARTPIKIRGRPPVEAAGDTTKPPIPALSYPDDPDFVVASPTTPGIIYYRRLMGVAFWDTTSGVTVRRLLSKYQGSIAGGMPFTGVYIMKFPDPGSSIKALTTRREQLKGEPGVKYVLLLTSRDAPPALD